jgi:hypothetical protein
MILMWIPGTALAQEARLTDDTGISSANRTANFGGAGAMSVNVNSSNLRGFIKFDLSTLPAGTTGNSVAKAVLTFYVANVGTVGSFNVHLGYRTRWSQPLGIREAWIDQQKTVGILTVALFFLAA